VDSRKSLALMSLVGAIPGGLLAFFGAMGGISGAGGLLMVTFWLAAVVGVILALLPVTAFTGIYPKAAGAAKAKKAKAEPEKKGAAEAAAPASEELDVADSDEIAEASDEFSAVSDDEFEFDDVDEFDEDEDVGKKKKKK